ncbi:unnamed protein product [Amoebophrya sp. A25]|nr:unnamed protein product [Amoebophrya sp. A25]|eukprot:GSA25T00022998001.1
MPPPSRHRSRQRSRSRGRGRGGHGGGASSGKRRTRGGRREREKREKAERNRRDRERSPQGPPRRNGPLRIKPRTGQTQSGGTGTAEAKNGKTDTKTSKSDDAAAEPEDLRKKGKAEANGVSGDTGGVSSSSSKQAAELQPEGPQPSSGRKKRCGEGGFQDEDDDVIFSELSESASHSQDERDHDDHDRSPSSGEQGGPCSHEKDEKLERKNKKSFIVEENQLYQEQRPLELHGDDINKIQVLEPRPPSPKNGVTGTSGGIEKQKGDEKIPATKEQASTTSNESKKKPVEQDLHMEDRDDVVSNGSSSSMSIPLRNAVGPRNYKNKKDHEDTSTTKAAGATGASSTSTTSKRPVVKMNGNTDDHQKADEKEEDSKTKKNATKDKESASASPASPLVKVRRTVTLRSRKEIEVEQNKQQQELEQQEQKSKRNKKKDLNYMASSKNGKNKASENGKDSPARPDKKLSLVTRAAAQLQLAESPAARASLTLDSSHQNKGKLDSGKKEKTLIILKSKSRSPDRGEDKVALTGAADARPTGPTGPENNAVAASSSSGGNKNHKQERTFVSKEKHKFEDAAADKRDVALEKDSKKDHEQDGKKDAPHQAETNSKVTTTTSVGENPFDARDPDDEQCLAAKGKKMSKAERKLKTKEKKRKASSKNKKDHVNLRANARAKTRKRRRRRSPSTSLSSDRSSSGASSVSSRQSSRNGSLRSASSSMEDRDVEQDTDSSGDRSSSERSRGRRERLRQRKRQDKKATSTVTTTNSCNTAKMGIKKLHDQVVDQNRKKKTGAPEIHVSSESPSDISPPNKKKGRTNNGKDVEKKGRKHPKGLSSSDDSDSSSRPLVIPSKRKREAGATATTKNATSCKGKEKVVDVVAAARSSTRTTNAKIGKLNLDKKKKRPADRDDDDHSSSSSRSSSPLRIPPSRYGEAPKVADYKKMNQEGDKPADKNKGVNQPAGALPASTASATSSNIATSNGVIQKPQGSESDLPAPEDNSKDKEVRHFEVEEPEKVRLFELEEVDKHKKDNKDSSSTESRCKKPQVEVPPQGQGQQGQPPQVATLSGVSSVAIDPDLPDLKDDPRPEHRRQNNMFKKGRNTESFDPKSTIVRPDLRVLIGNRGDQLKKTLKHDDVVIVPEFFCEEDDWSLYYKLVEEMREIQAKGTIRDAEWISWHEGTHLISKNPELSPTYQKVVEKICTYFGIKNKAKIGTRFNWYKDSRDWKPFHHDSAAFNPHRAQNQNITVGASFGRERELSLLRAVNHTASTAPSTGGGGQELPVKAYFPQSNGMMFSFGRDANINWKHGINALPDEEQDGKGRISIIVWGNSQLPREEADSPELLTNDARHGFDNSRNNQKGGSSSTHNHNLRNNPNRSGGLLRGFNRNDRDDSRQRGDGRFREQASSYVCRDWKRGRCTRDKDCKFKHAHD